MASRAENERKFPNWAIQPGDGRMYWLEIAGRFGWRARYVKVVNAQENTLSFRQEIYNDKGELVELHEKFPVDKGHQKLGME